MEKIEIPTAQNVKVEYQLANLVERGLAFIIDSVIIGIYVGFISMLDGLLFHSNHQILIWILATPVFTFYHLAFETFNNGQSLGKRLMGLRVVKTDGKLSDFKSYLIRFIFRTVDIYLSVFTIGSLCILGSHKNQRLGDMLADTAVVKVRGGRRFNLEGVKNGYSHTNDLVTYPAVKMLSEDEMLVVQETIIRYRKYKNAAHADAINMVVQKMEELLNVSCTQNKISFLETILKDYVALTR